MTNAETAALARIRQMTDAWEQRLPEVIRTPAVVSALRAVLDDAAPAVVKPPADDPMFGDDGCTCVPFTRQTDPPRRLNRPTDTVDMISGWERGRDCPHHASAVVEPPADQTAPVCRDAQGCHRVVPCDPGCGTQDLLAEATRPMPAPADQPATDVRDQLLHALDFSACLNAGYATPEALLAAYDTSRTPTVDQAALRKLLITALDNAHHTHPCPVTGLPYWTDCVHPDGTSGSCHSGRRADAVLAVLPEPADLAAALAETLIEQCPDHGCVEPAGEDGCHCAIVPLLRRMADKTPARLTPAERAVGRAEALAYFWESHDSLPYARSLRAALAGPSALSRLAEPAARARQDDYEHTTGHLITCFTVAGGNPDPDCSCAAGARQDGAV